jgi:hypothetical protein
MWFGHDPMRRIPRQTDAQWAKISASQLRARDDIQEAEWLSINQSASSHAAADIAGLSNLIS